MAGNKPSPAQAPKPGLERFIVAHPKTASALALAIGYVLGWITHW